MNTGQILEDEKYIFNILAMYDGTSFIESIKSILMARFNLSVYVIDQIIQNINNLEITYFPCELSYIGQNYEDIYKRLISFAFQSKKDSHVILQYCQRSIIYIYDVNNITITLLTLLCK